MQKKRGATMARENMVWGIGAFLAVAIAVVSDNAGSMLPGSLHSAMHSSRFGATDSIGLGAQVARLGEEMRVLERDNFQLEQRVSAVNRQGGAVSQRLASLESSVPDLLEGPIEVDSLDRGLTTASIGEDQPADSNVIKVRMVPLNPAGQTLPDATETMAKVDDSAEKMNEMSGIAPLSQTQFALDFGGKTSLGAGKTLWHALQSEAGTLLFGLEPLVREEVDGNHLVVGPISNVSQVLEVCQVFAQLGYDCSPSPFEGEKLAE